MKLIDCLGKRTPSFLSWFLNAFLFKWLEKGEVFQAKKLEKHIPGVPKSWKIVLKISGNHVCLSIPHGCQDTVVGVRGGLALFETFI